MKRSIGMWMALAGVCLFVTFTYGVEGTDYVSSGLDPNTPANELTEADTKKLMVQFISLSYNPDTIASQCAFVSAMLAAGEGLGKKSCKQMKKLCLEELSGEADELELEFEDHFNECEATVAEVEKCFNDQLTANRELRRRYNCSNLSEIDPDLIAHGPPTPRSCAALEKKCPVAFARQ